MWQQLIFPLFFAFVGYYTEKIGAAKMLRNLMPAGASPTTGEGGGRPGSSLFQDSSSSSIVTGQPVDDDFIEDAVEAVSGGGVNTSGAELVPELGMAAHRVMMPPRPASPAPALEAAAATASNDGASQLSHPLEDFDQIEKKFSSLKTSLVEKCQSSM